MFMALFVALVGAEFQSIHGNKFFYHRFYTCDSDYAASTQQAHVQMNECTWPVSPPNYATLIPLSEYAKCTRQRPTFNITIVKNNKIHYYETMHVSSTVQYTTTWEPLVVSLSHRD